MERFQDTWSDMKALIDLKTPIIEYENVDGRHYHVWFQDGQIVYRCHVAIEGTPAPDPSDQKDFEDNYKDVAHKPHGDRRSTFALGEYRFRGDCVSGTCNAGSTASLDLTLVEKHLLSGGEVVVTGAEIFDLVKFQVVAANGTTVLDEYVKGWCINPITGHGSISMEYAGTVEVDWILRLIYNADAAGGTRKFGINYFLHKPI